MNSRTVACVLIMMISASLLEGLATLYFVSSTTFNCSEVYNYCNDRNDNLILLNSQDTWNADCLSALGSQNICSRLHRPGLRLNSSYQCNTEGTWSYRGWANWINPDQELNKCHGSACVAVMCAKIKTGSCGDMYAARCSEDVPTTTQSTYSSVATPCVKTTTQSTHSAEVVTSDVKTTTQSTHSDVLTSDVKTTTQSTHSAEVRSDVRTTTQSIHSAEVMSDVNTTTQSTHSAEVMSDVKTTTQSTHSAEVTSDVKTTTQSTHSAEVTSDVRTTTQSTPSAEVTSDVKTTTQSTHSAEVTSDVKTTTQSTHSAEVTSDVRTTTQSTPTAGAMAVVPTMSANVVHTAYNNTLVDGSCEECCVKNNKSRQLSHEELKSVIKELKSQLAVNKNKLSTNRRKLISVYDSRPSSVAMGGVAIAIMIVIPGIIVIPDMVNLVRFMYRRQKKHFL